MQNWIVVRVNSGVVLALGLALLAPLLISLGYGDGSWLSFLIPAGIMIPLGAFGLWATKPFSRFSLGGVTPKAVFLSVTLAWVLAAVLGGVPYLIDETFQSPIASTFESMSGFTTTGSTLLSNIEAETPSILFWRSLTQWLGGIGIVMLLVAVAPALGLGGARLLSAEFSGIGQSRMTPRIVDTAKAILFVYLGLSVAETISLLLVGMSLYDAVLHTFTTVATGGFNPYTASVGFYDSLAIELVLIVFMTLSAISFSLYYLLYQGRSLRALLDRELLTYLAVLLCSIAFIWGVLVLTGDYANAVWQALRDSAFTVTSIMTTTGYVTADFDQWDAAAKFALLVLMFVGGCVGSTAGGLKVIRIIVVFRTIFTDLLRCLHPQAVTPLRIGEKVLPEQTRVAILGLVCAWIATFVAATLLVAVQPNLSMVSSATAVAATLNVVGPGMGQVGAYESFEIVNSSGRVVLTVCMLLGRLEIVTALALLTPAFWRH